VLPHASLRASQCERLMSTPASVAPVWVPWYGYEEPTSSTDTTTVDNSTSTSTPVIYHTCSDDKGLKKAIKRCLEGAENHSLHLKSLKGVKGLKDTVNEEFIIGMKPLKAVLARMNQICVEDNVAVYHSGVEEESEQSEEKAEKKMEARWRPPTASSNPWASLRPPSDEKMEQKPEQKLEQTENDAGFARALKKKLRQVDALKERAAQGHELNTAQKEKVQGEEALRAQLQELNEEEVEEEASKKRKVEDEDEDEAEDDAPKKKEKKEKKKKEKCSG